MSLPTALGQTETRDDRPVFKVLCVDGGGFKGLSTAAALSIIEERHGPLHEHFDLLCGTSTGGLIALGLAAGRSADDMVSFYRQHGPQIFPPLSRLKSMGHVLRVLGSGHKHKYSNKALQAAAEEILGKRQLRDSKCFLCIPALNMTTFVPRVFKTDHAPELSRDDALRMSDVALATSAAPTFFPITSCAESQEAQYYVDGGLWANNPALVGLTEALRFFAGAERPYKEVRLLSIGCASGVAGRLARPTYRRWANQFVMELIEASGEAQQKATQYHMDFLQSAFCVPVQTVRISINPMAPEQASAISLDVATKTAIETLVQLGIDTGHQWKSRPEIAAFFEAKAAKISAKSKP